MGFVVEKHIGRVGFQAWLAFPSPIFPDPSGLQMSWEFRPPDTFEVSFSFPCCS